MLKHEISNEPLDLLTLSDLITNNYQLSLSVEVISKVQNCRRYLDEKIANTTEPIYGINTGFGSLYKEHISKGELVKLQENIIKSHACGMGDEIPQHIVKLILLLKIQSLSYGHSGVQLATIQRLVDLYNHQALPVLYEFGSLGASGDLAPLAHLSLPLIGLGEVDYQGSRISGAELLAKLDWQPINLAAKEGLALLNGTQFMSAFGINNIIEANRLIRWSNLIGALSIDAYNGRIEPFKSEVHALRPHPGQSKVASDIRDYLSGSQIIEQPKTHVQDPYSFRCIPQVHGASMEVIDFVAQTFLTEVNSVTDNPNVFPELDEIISAGNFHGQPLAYGHDFLAISLAELGNISERRTYQLVSGTRELPNYLVANPGINSGLMIPQYTAASIVSQNKTLCHPASVDSIVSSNGQEDHVSMGANAATKGYQVIKNVYQILAIELITACQALELRRPLKSSETIEKLVSNFRQSVSFIEYDRVLHDDLVKATQFLKVYKFE